MYRQLREGAKLDAFQRAVIVFTIILCYRRRRRRSYCLRSLIAQTGVMIKLEPAINDIINLCFPLSNLNRGQGRE